MFAWACLLVWQLGERRQRGQTGSCGMSCACGVQRSMWALLKSSRASGRAPCCCAVCFQEYVGRKPWSPRELSSCNYCKGTRHGKDIRWLYKSDAIEQTRKPDAARSLFCIGRLSAHWPRQVLAISDRIAAAKAWYDSVHCVHIRRVDNPVCQQGTGGIDANPSGLPHTRCGRQMLCGAL